MRTVEECRSHEHYSLIPESTIWTINEYVRYGVPPGHFGHAILSNDLVESFGKADERNRAAMFEICMFLYQEVPALFRGSMKEVDDWLNHCHQLRVAEREEAKMVCVTCNKDLVECKCPDRDQRIKEGIVDNPGMVHKQCVSCKEHYLICKCPEPRRWESSDERFPLPEEYK